MTWPPEEKERYKLHMGFAPASHDDTTLSVMVGAFGSGQIRSEYTIGYHIARRYKIKPGDVNKILWAAEKYADGGYNAFKRNCVNFVVEMGQIINLPIAGQMEQREIKLNEGSKLVFEAGRSLISGTEMYTVNSMVRGMRKMDLNYQNFGQKMYTMEELDRFKKTAASSYSTRGYTPTVLGQKLKDDADGELSAEFEEHMNMDFGALHQTFKDNQKALYDKIKEFVEKTMWQIIFPWKTEARRTREFWEYSTPIVMLWVRLRT